jgi:hypothetical protein
MTPDYLKYLRARGLEEDQGFILIPHRCQHLHLNNVLGQHEFAGSNGSLTFEPIYDFACDIHESPDRPECCQKFHGQKIVKNMRIYIPPGCGYREDTDANR